MNEHLAFLAKRAALILRGLLAGVRLEGHNMRRSPDELLALVTAPVLTLVFLSITLHAGRTDLSPYAVLAPALLALWQMALLTSGETVAAEREDGTLEGLVASPASFVGVITGRILTVTLISLAGFVESWLVAALVFGIVVPVVHPGAFLIAALATAFATAGTAVILSAMFVLSRSARTFQNSLSYPFYVLGGVMVPVAYLPEWLQPVTRLIFLSWSSDLLRDAVTPGPVPDLALRVGIVLLLGLAGFVVGAFLVRRAIRRVRRTGTMAYV